MNINATLIAQSITFFIFVWFCMKYVWPPLVNALNERKKKIADGIAAAERGMQEQELAAKAATEKLAEAKVQAGEILAQAQKRATEIVEEAKSDAREEGSRLIEAAKAEIDQEVHRAKEQLRKQVAAIAISGASKVLEREVNETAHSELLDKLAAEI